MPKPRHHQANAREQRWFLWALTAVAVSFVLAVAARATSPTSFVVPIFALLLLAFFAGSLSGKLFLTRSTVVRPSDTQSVLPARPVIDSSRLRQNEIPEEATSVPARPPAPKKSTEDAPRFASSRDANKILEVAVLVSANEHWLDPADGGPLIAWYHDVGSTDAREEFPAPLGSDGDAPSPVSMEVEPGPYPGSVQAMPDGWTPHADYCVKGNTRSMLYHTTQSPYFSRTKASVWFRSTADAERAGFAAWNRRAQHA